MSCALQALFPWEIIILYFLSIQGLNIDYHSYSENIVNVLRILITVHFVLILTKPVRGNYIHQFVHQVPTYKYYFDRFEQTDKNPIPSFLTI